MLVVFVVCAGAATTGYMLWTRHEQKIAHQEQAAKEAQKEAERQKRAQEKTQKERQQQNQKTEKQPSQTAPSLAPAEQPDVRIPPVEDGLAPVISKLDTSQPVVFLTIDDGIHKNHEHYEFFKRQNVKASLFLTYQFIKNDPAFFKPFIADGSRIENHTLSHNYLSRLSYEGQKEEICGQADEMQRLYGPRPVLLRPPGGYYDVETRQAAATCGMKAIVMWSAKANGGKMEYQVGSGLRPGDIVLMHFRPEFKQDLQSFMDAVKQANMRVGLLEDWLPKVHQMDSQNSSN